MCKYARDIGIQRYVDGLGELAGCITIFGFFTTNRLKTACDVVSRTGNSLVLGWLHRYVGGMGAG